jgi:hypothetical protein
MIRTAACLIVRNEADDIAEWAIHHHLIGFATLIIYDHQSTDDTRAILTALSDTIPIILHDWADQSRERQNAAYRDCLARHGASFDWIAFLDADEFLIPRTAQILATLLHRHAEAAGIAFNWLIFGTSGLAKLTPGSVMTTLTRRSPVEFDVNRHVKSIVRPGAVRRVLNPHAFELDGDTIHPDGALVAWDSPGVVAAGTAHHETWRINHYFLRSAAHWTRRLARGQLGADPRHAAQFAVYDRNEIEDRTALPHAAAVADFVAAGNAAPDQRILCVLDAIENGAATGWAFDRTAPDAALSFTASIDGRSIGDIDCRHARPDLLQAGYPERSGFRFTIPDRYRDGAPHHLEFRLGDAAFGIHRNGTSCRLLEFHLNG